MKFAYQSSRRGFWITVVEYALTALLLLYLIFVIIKVLSSGLLFVE